jgi:hypothetical protein
MVKARLVQRRGDTAGGMIMETKIVLKNRRTNAYLGENNGWLESPALARRFETPYHALYFCVSEELDGVDIMLRAAGEGEVRFLRC